MLGRKLQLNLPPQLLLLSLVLEKLRKSLLSVSLTLTRLITLQATLRPP
jgi:hypothetical protein